MERQSVLKRIVMSLQLQHQFFYKYKQKFIERIDRLDYLLWGKTADYEGPLYDGFQPNEWAFIAILVGAWLIETYKLTSSTEKQDLINSLFSKENMTSLAIQLIKKIVENQLIKTTDQDKKNMEVFLATLTIKNFIQNELGDKLNATRDLLLDLAMCCGSSKKTVTSKIYKSTELTGLFATGANKHKGINMV